MYFVLVKFNMMFVYGSEIYFKLKTCKEKNKSRHYSVQPETSLLKFPIKDKIFFKASWELLGENHFS